MIGALLGLLTGNPLARFLAKLAGIALAVLSFGLWQRRQGAHGAKAKQAEAALEATTKGQEAARKGRAEATERLAKGATPQQVKEGNDAKW
jgi:hypothetical protein